MDYALLAATALGAIGLYLMLPRERAPLTRLGLLMGAMAFASLCLFLVRAANKGYGGSDERPPVYFYLFAAIMIGGAIGVVCQPRPVYAALYFVLVTLAGAGMFVLLMADFMAIVLIIIYAGAILVTYVFVIMLASQGSVGGNVVAPAYDRRAAGGYVPVVMAFVLVGAIVQSLFPAPPTIIKATWGTATLQSDVTEVVKSHVSNGGLRLAVNSRTFGDPAPGSRKVLTLSYQGKGFAKEEKFADGATVLISNEIAEGHLAQTADPLMARSYNLDPVTGAQLPDAAGPTPTNVQLLGVSLYSRYSLSLELAGILLTIALVGAVVISRKNTPERQELGGGGLPAE